MSTSKAKSTPIGLYYRPLELTKYNYCIAKIGGLIFAFKLSQL